MFQFPAFPPIYLCVQYMVSTHYCRCVPTFGYLWVVGCLHLTIAFRSLPRPSSAPIAKAFTLCSSLLNLWVSIRFSFVEIVYPFFLSDLSLNLFGCYTFLDIFRFDYIIQFSRYSCSLIPRSSSLLLSLSDAHIPLCMLRFGLPRAPRITKNFLRILPVNSPNFWRISFAFFFIKTYSAEKAVAP